MEKEDKLILNKIIFWAMILLLGILTYLIIKSYLAAIISAYILAYLVKPLHRRLSNKLNPKLAAIVCILIIVLIIVLPLILIAQTTISQAYNLLGDKDLKSTLEKLSENAILKQTGISLDTITQWIISLLIDLLSSALKYAPLLIITIVIMLWGVYYILIEWDSISANLKRFIPFKNKEKSVKDIDNATKALVHGTFFIALIEFALVATTFGILGINGFLILATLVGIFAFIPGLGPIIIWAPTAAYQIIQANYVSGIIIIIVGLIMSIGIETFLLGRIVQSRAKINPLVSFIGIIGGVPLFGIFGIIIGPLILIYTLKIGQEAFENSPQV
jgi:predicted PurR-regulated permease PerM